MGEQAHAANEGSRRRQVEWDDPGDRALSVGDWVRGRPGVANSGAVRAALDGLKAIDVVVPVWDAAAGLGSDAIAVQCDITDEASVTAAVEQVVAEAGGIDVCISNAGIATGYMC